MKFFTVPALACFYSRGRNRIRPKLSFGVPLGSISATQCLYDGEFFSTGTVSESTLWLLPNGYHRPYGRWVRYGTVPTYSLRSREANRYLNEKKNICNFCSGTYLLFLYFFYLSFRGFFLSFFQPSALGFPCAKDGIH